MAGPTEPVRVLVVDADRRVRQSLAGLIGVSDGLALVGAVGDPLSAMDALEGGGADVVLIDPRLPEAEVGVALLGTIRARWPETRIVALTMVGRVAEAAGDPARVTVVSPASPELLVDALRGHAPRGLAADRPSMAR